MLIDRAFVEWLRQPFVEVASAACDEPVQHAARRFLRRVVRQICARHHVAAIHRARQRDIDEARALGRLLARGLAARVVLLLVVAAVVKHGRAVVAVIFARIGQTRRRRLAHAAVVEKRTEHDRVFETLRLVHGDDLHEIAVRFEPQLRLLAARCAARTLDGQPAQRRRDARLRRGARLHEFGEMVDVGEPPLAFHTGDEALRDVQFAHQRAPHHGEAALVPQHPVARKALDPAHRIDGLRGIDRAGRALVEMLESP